MKNLCLILVALFFSFNAFAQTEKKIIEKVSEGLCDCASKVYGFIDSDIQGVIVKMTMIKSSDEQEAFVKSLEEDLLKRLMEQAAKMQDEVVSKDFEKCLNRVELEVSNYFSDEVESDMTEEKLMEMLLLEVQKVEGCEFASFLFAFGMQQKSANKDASEDKRYGSGGN